jgi:hypothetical protein
MDASDHGSPPSVSGPVNKAGPDPGEIDSGGPDPGRPGGGGADPGKIVLAVNSVIAAVGGTYASTHSIAATVVAGGAGLAFAAVIVWKR